MFRRVNVGQETNAPDTRTTNMAVFDCANFRDVLREGWSAIEEGYVWSCQMEAILRLTLPVRGGEYLLRLAADSFTVPDVLPEQRVAVFVNGLAMGAATVAGFGIIECRLPPLPGGSDVVIRLELPDARRPSEFDAGNSDDRLLGISLRQIAVREAKSAESTDGRVEPFRARRAPLDEAAKAALMTRFESLGENCEFGLVQRRCGAEPLGLLRFSSAPLPKLLAALDAQFAGMGARNNISVELSPNEREYMVQDRAFGFYYHAWVNAGEMAPAQIEAREIARVPFLVRKLREDLEEGLKIFVFHAMEDMSVASAHLLADAIRRYGPGTLLWVRLADESHPPASTEVLREGLIVGYIDRFAPGTNAHDLSLDCWVDLCQSALESAVRLPAPKAKHLRCVPPFALMNHWLTTWAVPGSTRIRPPYDDVLDVLRAMMAIVPVDEAWYLAEYPDVAGFIDRNKDETAASHFRKHGYFRGRHPFADGWRGLERPVCFTELCGKCRIIPARGGLFAEMDREDFLHMVRRILRAVRVDEEWYRSTYPGAAAEIESGRFSTATEHYVTTGYFEGGLPADVEVDADWYLGRYAHVRTGLAIGVADSAKDHFLRIGYGEGCQPTRP
jgi:hypothetical protein